MSINVKDAAKLLRVSDKTIRRRIRKGELHADIINGKHGPELRLNVAELLKKEFGILL